MMDQKIAQLCLGGTIVAATLLGSLASPSWSRPVNGNIARAEVNSGRYTAIAYSPSHRTPFRASATTSMAATQAALQECETNGGDCRFLGNYDRGWVAIAVATDGTYGNGWSNRRQANVATNVARHRALQSCRANGGSDCRTIYIERVLRSPVAIKNAANEGNGRRTTPVNQPVIGVRARI
jgi:hypothetical protein